MEQAGECAQGRCRASGMLVSALSFLCHAGCQEHSPGCCRFLGGTRGCSSRLRSRQPACMSQSTSGRLPACCECILCSMHANCYSTLWCSPLMLQSASYKAARAQVPHKKQ